MRKRQKRAFEPRPKDVDFPWTTARAKSLSLDPETKSDAKIDARKIAILRVKPRVGTRCTREASDTICN